MKLQPSPSVVVAAAAPVADGDARSSALPAFPVSFASSAFAVVVGPVAAVDLRSCFSSAVSLTHKDSVLLDVYTKRASGERLYCAKHACRLYKRTWSYKKRIAISVIQLYKQLPLCFHSPDVLMCLQVNPQIVLVAQLLVANETCRE